MIEYRFIGPDGKEHTGSNLRQFCRDHKLDHGNMWQVHWGCRRHHKGFTAPDSGYVRTYSMANR